MDIPILNIYYLLSYAWDKLDEAEPKEVSQVDNHNVINLFARVLSNRTAYLLRRGLDRGYIEKQYINQKQMTTPIKIFEFSRDEIVIK